MKTFEKLCLAEGFRRRESFVADTTWGILKELRKKRQKLILSNTKVSNLFEDDDYDKEYHIENLSLYLAERGSALWQTSLPKKAQALRRFFELSFNALANEEYDSCLDDAILLAELLVRSKQCFKKTLLATLPESWQGELYFFLEVDGFEKYFNPQFEDAVLGAISVLTGALPDPLENLENKENRDEQQ